MIEVRLRPVTPFLDDAIAVAPLAGGTHHTAWIATQADGTRYVVKSTPGVPPDMFDTEAEGLTVLRRSGVIGAPRVVAVGADHLVMEALNPVPGFADTGFWERAGRALARLHLIRGARFG